MRSLLISIISMAPVVCGAVNIQHCGNTTIEQVIAGTRHGSLLNLANNECGNSGYVCIDLEGQHGSKEKGSAAYSFALAAHMAERAVSVSVDLDSKPASCGGDYPVVEDIRTMYINN